MTETTNNNDRREVGERRDAERERLVAQVVEALRPTPGRAPANRRDAVAANAAPRRTRRRAAAVMIAAGIGLAAAVASIFGFESYGVGLFAVLPVAVGFMAVAIAARDGRIGLIPAAMLGLASVACVGAMFLLMGLEGLICMMMAVPLWAPGGMLGGLIAAVAMAWVDEARWRGLMLAAVLMLLPATMGAEWLVKPAPTEFAVTTAVEIDAPRQAVWANVIGFDTLPEPTEWLFTHGVAYPTHATIEGRGVGAVRRCTFSTGSFVEPITVWDEPAMLAFDVTENPPPMTEWSLYERINAPHLHGFFESKRGQFELIELDGGRRTRLVGTTWYVHGIRPEWYWRLWSDRIIHEIHDRVLGHIKRTSEDER